MLSDSPPERDVDWTTAGVEGAWRFLQRLWRLQGEAKLASPGALPPADFGAKALALRRATHKTIIGVTSDIENFTFNKAVARIYELTNAVAKLSDEGEDFAYARREAFETIAALMEPMTPHFAEELWAQLGGEGMLVARPWPDADTELARDDMISLPIQVNGKKRAEISVSAEAGREEIEGLALTNPDVARFLDGKPPKKIIVVPGRIVNVVL